MTISTEVRKAGPFIGNDSASVFPFAFKVFKAADLIVVRRQDNIGTETTLVLDSDYHVTLNGNQDTTPGGVVTLVAGALASGFTLVVSSELPYLQPTDLTNQGGFYPKVITNALDRLTIFCQQLAEITGRTLKLPITAPTDISAEIPLPNPSELIAWDETGTRLTTISPQSLVTSIAYGSATADLFAGDGVTTTFPLSTNPASVNNLDVSIDGHSQRPVQGGVGDYSWNGGASITFVTPPPAPSTPGDKNVLVRYMQAIPVSDSEALHAQTREALRRGYAEAGFNLVDGSFETGGTLTATADVLLQESTGVAYAWTGAFPKVVAPGFDPAGVVGFELRTDVVLRSELAAVGGIGLAAPIPSISSLLSLTPFNGMRVDVLSFYAGAGKGGGTFVYDDSLPTTNHNGVTIISKNATFSGSSADTLSFLTTPGAAGTGCWVRQLEGSSLSVAMGGAVADGVFDCSAICQRIHNLGLHVKYNAGNYQFSTTVQLHAGCVVYSEGSSYFSNDTKRCVNITNTTLDGGIFHYTTDTSVGQVACPSIIGFKLTADYPIMLNKFTDKIADGTAGVNPYLMRGIIKDNYIFARQAGVGIGISASKMFDSAIENNEVYNFAVNIAAIGCDLNSIKRNRIVGFTLYGICERSASTFGSQNEITLNDILAGGPTSIYIKSTARHVRIYNNYCERASGSLRGFIDLTPNSLPVWGPGNIDSKPFSIFVRDNRLDGLAFCTDFVYRLDGDNPAPMTIIEDSSTRGQSASVDVLSIVSTPVGGLLKYAIGEANFNFPEYHLKGDFGRFAGFSSQHLGRDIELNARNLTKVVRTDVYGNGADAYLRTNGESICVLTGLTKPIFLRFPSLDGVNNPYFADGVTYTCEIIARTSTTIGDTLSAARIVGSGGGSLNNFTLTDQWKKFTFTMPGAPTTQAVGVYLTRSTQNGIIQIKSIRFVQV